MIDIASSCCLVFKFFTLSRIEHFHTENKRLSVVDLLYTVLTTDALHHTHRHICARIQKRSHNATLRIHTLYDRYYSQKVITLKIIWLYAFVILIQAQCSYTNTMPKYDTHIAMRSIQCSACGQRKRKRCIENEKKPTNKSYTQHKYLWRS